ncbi:MAG: SCP2 sterol-binding domain-containing protein [Saprospiraceae bacterium]|nr:SCP2 sterol-binding domain-containing protein [Saprospiraceae bacterium]
MDFETLLAGMKERAANASPLGKTLKFDFGEDQQLLIDGTGEENVVSAADSEADTVVKVSIDDFVAVSKGEMNPMTAVMTGKIKIKGDMGLAMKLQSLLG